jgi:hypothetical protein
MQRKSIGGPLVGCAISHHLRRSQAIEDPTVIRKILEYLERERSTRPLRPREGAYSRA